MDDPAELFKMFATAFLPLLPTLEDADVTEPLEAVIAALIASMKVFPMVVPLG